MSGVGNRRFWTRPIGRLLSLGRLAGVDFKLGAQSAAALPWYVRSLKAFKALARSSRSEFTFGKLYPCLLDRHDEGGIGRGHYFHQDMLVARRIFERMPERHADIGSRFDGFVAHVAVFRKIEVFDIRPITGVVHNVKFVQLDVTRQIDPLLQGAYDSISCLHALEHIGLGRYGDSLSYYGYISALESISSLLRAGGILYLSVPIGPQRIEFNAHRVFSLPYLLKLSRERHDIVSLSYVDDRGDLFENVAEASPEVARSFDCNYGLAILELAKR